MRIEVNGVGLFFDVEGAKLVPDGPVMREKPTLIALHGGPGNDHSTLKPFFSQFADIAQVVYIDQRANGRSDRGPEDLWNLAQWGDDVRAFCDALEIEKPIVWGASFGGMVAQSYATRHAGHPAKLILSSTRSRRSADRSVTVFTRLGGSEVGAIARSFFDSPTAETGAAYREHCVPHYHRRVQPDHDVATRMTRNTSRLALQFFQREAEMNFLPELSRIACPTLVMGGEDDPICTIDDMADTAAALPGHLVRFERFPECGHFLRREDPERTLRVMREFILS
jgi:pimeloyl-ACP methyl ester carboxylesterase